ncbi:hypothetical protein Trydic_g8586 [Trypoxylus dichotomus]
MSEKKLKTEKTGGLRLIFPKVKPTDCIQDYLQSKQEVNQTRYNNATWEVSRDCAIVHLLDAKKHLDVRSNLLSQFRTYAVLKREHFSKKWEELATKEESFKLMFKRFNKFVRENHEKRDRAEKKITDEIELQHKRETDIDIMTDHYRQVSDIKNLMEKMIKEHRMYEDYLQTVVRASQSYKNLNELLYRYESLIETKNVLSEKQHNSLVALELARANMVKLIEEKTLVLVGLQNQLANLQERYDLAYNKSLQWESNVSKIQDVCNHEYTTATIVRSSIDDIYQALCIRKNIEPTLAVDNYEQKLIFINKTMGEMERVLRKMKYSKKKV